MIFVAVGTQKFPFDRLLKGIDDLIEQGQLEQDVFAQIGHTDYVPRNYGYQNFLSKDDFRQRTKVSKPAIELMSELGRFGELQESNQLSLFDFA